MVLTGVLGAMLIYDHRDHLLGGNGLLITLLLLCVGSHFFLHGHRGGHDHNGDSHNDNE